MPNVEKSPIHAPNERFQSLAQKRSATPAASGPKVHDPSASVRDGRLRPAPGASANFGRFASPVQLDNHRFNIEYAKMPNPPSAVTPGRGAIPVDLGVGQPATGFALRDEAKK
jgi:hypothetical protein